MAGVSLGNFFDLDGSAAPGLSAANSSRVYFDTTKLQLMMSANAGAYQYLLADALDWGSAAPGSTNTFMTPYSAAVAASEVVGQFPAPKTGHLAGLYVKALNANFSAGGNATLRVAGADTALVATYTTGVSIAADDTDIVAVNRGDLISIRLSVALTNTPIWAGVLLLP
jgi:hypothetical protein